MNCKKSFKITAINFYNNVLDEFDYSNFEESSNKSIKKLNEFFFSSETRHQFINIGKTVFLPVIKTVDDVITFEQYLEYIGF